MLKVINPSNFVPQDAGPSQSPPLAGRAWRHSVGLQDIQFIASSTSTTLGASIESKFKPLNDLDTPPSPRGKERELNGDEADARLIDNPTSSSATPSSLNPPLTLTTSPLRHTSTKTQATPSGNDDPVAGTSSQKPEDIFLGTVPSHWPKGSARLACGLVNQGNTCFLNSVLQCMFYTPPLLNMLLRHTSKPCRVTEFCMACQLGDVTFKAYNSSRGYISPIPITRNLNFIAKHMRRGRQEDAHEFLRYSIDALQKSALAGQPPKLDPRVAETTWVHKIFGGRLRSRVTCKRCHHPSDTFDSCLDLSLDLGKGASVEQALANFVTPEYLTGENKYKCEKCKIPVNAEKQFTIHQAPQVLTIHLKRFSITGRKVTKFIQYPKRIDLQPYVSKGEIGPTYSLYGIISHAGGGPHSGHYYAHIKTALGNWHEMNDEAVSPPMTKPPLGLPSAYVLFYLRDRSSGLEQVVGIANGSGSPQKRRFEPESAKQEDSSTRPLKKNKVTQANSSTAPIDEDIGVPFKTPEVTATAAATKNPEADALSRKIQALGATGKSDPLLTPRATATTATSVITVKANTKLVDYSDECSSDAETEGTQKADDDDPEKTRDVEEGPSRPPNLDAKPPGATSPTSTPKQAQFIGPLLPPSRDHSSATLISSTASEGVSSPPLRASATLAVAPASATTSQPQKTKTLGPNSEFPMAPISSTSGGFYGTSKQKRKFPDDGDNDDGRHWDHHYERRNSDHKHHRYQPDYRERERRRDRDHRDDQGRRHFDSRRVNPFSSANLASDNLHQERGEGPKQGVRDGKGAAKNSYKNKMKPRLK